MTTDALRGPSWQVEGKFDTVIYLEVIELLVDHRLRGGEHTPDCASSARTKRTAAAEGEQESRDESEAATLNRNSQPARRSEQGLNKVVILGDAKDLLNLCAVQNTWLLNQL